MTGDVPAHRLIDLGLARRVGQMIVAANDMGDAHVVIVDDDRQHIGRRCRPSAAARGRRVPCWRRRPCPAPCRRRSSRRPGALEPDHRRDARRRLGRIAVAPAPVVAHRPAFGARLLAHLLEFLRARVAAIGAARGEQLLGDLAMARGARELLIDLAVPIEPEPVQPVDDRVDRRLGSSARGRCPRCATGTVPPKWLA